MASLAVKYRPKTFEDVSEQSAILAILKNICGYDELENRNFLFIGPAGTGKTTIGRIMAKTLNGGNEDIIEIDAASHNGVDSVKELLENARSFPIGMKYKVFLLDECHAFSNQAWQVFLKALEEGLGRSIFIFCTTNPEKIPATILSRVQTFQLSKLSLDAITKRLIYIISAEIESGRVIEYEESAVQYLAKLANGGMRDAITLLDKVLAYGSEVTIESIMSSLSLPHYDDYFSLLSAYAKKDNKAIVEIIHRVYNSGVNFVQWFEQFHSFIMNVVKYILLQDINETMIPAIYLDRISKYSSSHSVVCLRLADKMIHLIAELKTTQYLEETALTYLMQISKGGK